MGLQTFTIFHAGLVQIQQGRKTLDVRVGYQDVRNLRRGATLDFVSSTGSATVTLLDVRQYDSFEHMLAHESPHKIMPGYSRSRLLGALREVYKPWAEGLGVHVLEIRLVRFVRKH